MTGSDIEFWLEGIWYDLTDLGSADVPTLLFKLFVLAVVVFFGWHFGRMVTRGLWSVVQPVLSFFWKIVTAPVWLPWRGLKRLYRPVVRRRAERRYRREQLQAAEQQWAREREQAAKHAEALAAAGKILDVD